MKRRGRPPRDCAIEKTRHENADIGKIEPEASMSEYQSSETESARGPRFKDKPMTEGDVSDEMVRVVTMALGGIAPNAWGLTDPKRIIAAVCNAVGRGWA
jgi:hypothetical protein